MHLLVRNQSQNSSFISLFFKKKHNSSFLLLAISAEIKKFLNLSKIFNKHLFFSFVK